MKSKIFFLVLNKFFIEQLDNENTLHKETLKLSTQDNLVFSMNIFFKKIVEFNCFALIEGLAREAGQKPAGYIGQLWDADAAKIVSCQFGKELQAGTRKSGHNPTGAQQTPLWIEWT